MGVEKVYNFKRLDLNGNLTMYAAYGRDVWKGARAVMGQKHLNLSDTVDWDIGDEVLLSSSKHHGAGGHGQQPGLRLCCISYGTYKDGRTLYLDTALTQDYVGEVDGRRRC